MKKKIICYFLILICTCHLLVNAKEKVPYIDARSAIAIDGKSKIVLYEKNAYTPIPMASTTKIMTCLVALNYGELDEKLEVSSKAASIRGAEIGYKKGEKISLEELLYGLMMKSGNDAAITIAEGIGGSIEGFSKMMNEYAMQIGLLNSNFESPHGLDSANHYTSAYDLALLTSVAMENTKFKEIVNCRSISEKEKNFTRAFNNINKILHMIPNANGVKTGYTGQAGKCLVTSVELENRNIIIVTLNCTPRWKETTRIYDYVKDNYEFKDVIEEGKELGEIFVENSTNPCKLVCPEKLNIPIKKGKDATIKIVKPEKLFAPIEVNESIGHLEVWSEDKCIYNLELRSKDKVGSSNRVKLIIRDFIRRE